MHLVFLNQYYPPDAAPTGVMLEGLVRGMVEAGHEVTVLCSAGGYAGSQAIRLRSEDGGLKKEDNDSANSPSLIPDLKPRLHIHRIRASRYGRDTFLGKLMDYASYMVGVGWRLLTLRPRPDRIVALTTPPYLSVMARLMSKLRGADHAHWVMDLYPDVMAAHGMLAERRLIYRVLTGLTRWGFGGKRCAAVLTLGPDMAARVEGYVKKKVIGEPLISASSVASSGIGEEDDKQVRWVPLWSAEEVVSDLSSVIRGEEESATPQHHHTATPGTEQALALRRQRGWSDQDVVVMYSGNMGLGHRFGEFLEAAKALSEKAAVRVPMISASSAAIIGQPATHPSTLRWVFFGAGKRRGEVKTFVSSHPGAGVELYDYAPAEGLAAHLQSADVHLASLAAEWTGTMVPSKVQGIFGVGRPVIFIGSAASSIGQWVHESGGGWVLEPGDVGGLLAALAEARDPAVRMERGRAAKTFAEAHFDKATNVARLVTVLGAGGGAES